MLNYGVIPGVFYTHLRSPALAGPRGRWKKGRARRTGRKFSFMGNAGQGQFAGDGFVKILADQDTDRILGAHIIGARWRRP